MDILPLKTEGAYRIVPDVYRDHRGFFTRTYDEDQLARRGMVTRWVQESHSFSAKKGTVRGLHFQHPPHGETKLVRAAQGKIFMVLLDLRAASRTFRCWESIVISIEEPQVLYTPPGIAMGMCTLTDDCSLLYKMDVPYEPKSGRTVRWNDPELAVPWPVEEPILSQKDNEAPLLKEFLASEGAL